MSGQTPSASGAADNVSGAAKAAADPSMEDILASIRRILSEEDEQKPEAPAAEDDVLALDESMLVAHTPSGPAPASPTMGLGMGLGSVMGAAEAEEQGTPRAGIAPPMPQAVPITVTKPVDVVEPPPPQPAPPAPPEYAELTSVLAAVQPSVSESAAQAEPSPYSLVAPEAAAAAATAMSQLVRSLQAERHAAVYRGGPSLEDVVREEIRPVLKAWLDTHLPGIVERIVRTEIERLVGRATP